MILMPDPDAELLARRHQILAQLCKILHADPAALICDDAALVAYDTDALTAYRCKPLAVVLPKNNAQVSKVLRFCNQEGIKVIARGSGTSLAGGALPSMDSILLSLSRMNRVLNVDFENRTAFVQAGVTNIAISRAAEEQGFFYAPDPSSQIACSIAGNVATNAGGPHCLKYGVTANNLLGLTFVTIEGDILSIGGEFLDPDGYDLLGIITGSEGMLGVVTEVLVRILPKAPDARPMLLGFHSEQEAGACVAAIIGAGVLPVAIEFMDKAAIMACETFAKAGYPLDAKALLIIEVEGEEAEIEEAFAIIYKIAQGYNPLSLRVSRSTAESEAIWRGRKSAFGAMGQLAPDYLCMDGTIPTGQLPYVLAEIEKIGQRYGFPIANIFHAGDGNMHPLIMYDAKIPGAFAKVERAGAEILELCVKVGGCLSGEHGIGIEKRELMPLMFTPKDLEQQRRVKDAFDPKWLLNPAKVFPLECKTL